MLLALLVLVLAPAPAVAGELSSRLLLTVAAPAPEAERLEAVTRELLARLQMRVEMRRVERIDVGEMRQGLAADRRYFARVWIALPRAGRARLYLEHGETDRVLVREVASDAGNPELVREELGHILQAAVEGLLAGEEVGAPRRDALKEVAAAEGASPTSAEEPKPKSEPTLSRRGVSGKPSGLLRFGPRYEVSWLGNRRFEDGPGAALELQLAPPVGIELSAYYRRPLKVAGEPVGVRLQTLSMRGLLTARVRLSPRGALRLGAGVGPDLVRVSPIANAEITAEVAGSKLQKLALGRVQSTYAHRAFSFMELELTVGLDLDFNGTRYVFQRTSGELRVLDPSPVRPFFSLGATVP